MYRYADSSINIIYLDLNVNRYLLLNVYVSVSSQLVPRLKYPAIRVNA